MEATQLNGVMVTESGQVIKVSETEVTAAQQKEKEMLGREEVRIKLRDGCDRRLLREGRAEKWRQKSSFGKTFEEKHSQQEDGSEKTSRGTMVEMEEDGAF